MPNTVTSAARLREAQARISWIESHPAFSGWLKDTLRSAVARNPVDVINDLEILHHVLRGWASASIELQRSSSDPLPLPSSEP
jgi:hypothetical protein